MSVAKNKKANKTKLDKDVKALVKARLNTLPKDVNLSIGEDGSFNRDELIQHIEKEDLIGQKVARVEMGFLQAIKKGEFYENTFDYQARP